MSQRTKSAGFTLVELVVATAVLIMILVLTAQLASHTMDATTASGKQIDSSSMARTMLDRFGNDLSGAVLNGGATALYYSGSPGGDVDPSENSAFGFASNTRARFTFNNSVDEDVRGVVLGYKIRNQTVPLGGGGTAMIPLIARGDASFTYAQAGGGTNADFSLWNIFGVNGRELPTDLTSASDTSFLTWQGIGDGVVRFHISFLLSDGTMTQDLQQGTAPNWTLNATYRDFRCNGGTGSALPIAFSADTSADPNKRYVKGLLVGIAVLDEATLKLAFTNNSNFTTTLAGQLKRPTADGETPLSVWQANLTNVDFPPARQNLRFYQRFFPISL